MVVGGEEQLIKEREELRECRGSTSLSPFIIRKGAFSSWFCWNCSGCCCCCSVLWFVEVETSLAVTSDDTPSLATELTFWRKERRKKIRWNKENNSDERKKKIVVNISFQILANTWGGGGGGGK